MDAIEHVARIIARSLGHNDDSGMHWQRYVLAARDVVEEYEPQALLAALRAITEATDLDEAIVIATYALRPFAVLAKKD